MKIKVLLTLIVIFISFTFKSNTQVNVNPDSKFEVCVYVIPNNDTDLDTQLETSLRRELQALGDVVLVEKDTDWDFLLVYNLLENRAKDGTKTGSLSIASAVMLPHTRINHKTYGSPGVGKPALLGDLKPATLPADNLHEYAKQSIGTFDKVRLRWEQITFMVTALSGDFEEAIVFKGEGVTQHENYIRYTRGKGRWIEVYTIPLKYVVEDKQYIYVPFAEDGGGSGVFWQLQVIDKKTLTTTDYAGLGDRIDIKSISIGSNKKIAVEYQERSLFGEPGKIVTEHYEMHESKLQKVPVKK